MKYTIKNGVLRLYDATTVATGSTHFYLAVLFYDGDFTAPVGDPTVEEILVLDRQTMDSNASYAEGSDEALLAPLPLSFSVTVTDDAEFTYLMDWIAGQSVNSNVIVSTKGSTMRDGAVANPAFADSGKKTCNIEVSHQSSGGTDEIVWHYNEVLINESECSVNEAAEGTRVSVTGQVYGTILRNTSFTTGTAV